MTVAERVEQSTARQEGRDCMQVELNTGVLRMVCEVAFSNMHGLNHALEEYRKAKPKNEADKRRIDAKIKEIKAGIERAEGVHGLFTEILENYEGQ